ncbi:MAG TPA: UDP-N-acetylmuramate dehydrogenase [Candidatus Omnitrophota bacterium]|nr:UDP-N-acetylmuramate dehydrogenase [Candidatus Omnitrophota bacterium]
MSWWKGLKGRLRLKEPLKRHTTFKVGGPARFFIEPLSIGDLRLLCAAAKKYKLRFFPIGSGSNILAADKVFGAIVMQLSSPLFKRTSFDRNNLEVGSGLPLGRLIQKTISRGLSGLEFLSGIPGTVGGALAMNAGCWGKNIGPLVEKALVMDYNGKIIAIDKKDIKFTYRNSSLSKYIILSAHLKLIKKNRAEIKEEISRCLNLRKSSQDKSYPSAGCVFKNPPYDSAGRLIDLCGLKGKRIGGACISTKHANFILNKGNARAADVLRLMSLIKRTVKRKFNITLEPEIKIWQ